MLTLDCSAPAAFAARLYPIARFDGQMLWVAGADGQLHPIAPSIRFTAAQIRDWVRRKAQVLVMPIAESQQAASACFGVGIDFVGGAPSAPGPQIVCADELCLGDGAARIFWDSDALHIAAENIDSQARFVHRINGGSIKIG